MWVGGFEGPYATLYLYPTPVPVAAFPLSFGWTASILLEIPANSTNSITLDGADIYNGSTLLFQVDSSQEPTAYITLDPQHATYTQSKPGAEQRISWSITMYFSTAGCYMLNAVWPGGQWHVNFAAGR